MLDLTSICESVCQIAKDTGAFITNESTRFNTDSVEYKAFNNLVSYVDKTSEERLVKALSALLPEAGFVTEEGTADYNNESYRWIIDPLDGTTNFTHGLPVYSISIALAKDKEFLIGVVYDITRNECFYATKGGGAYCNGKKIQVAATPILEKSLIATGFPYYLFEKLDAYMAIIKDLVQCTQGLRRMGSAAIDLCYVACGRFDAYFEYNLQPYDVAAGILIVQEAGGVVSDFTGGANYHDGKEVIVGGAVQAALTAVIKKHWTS